MQVNFFAGAKFLQSLTTARQTQKSGSGQEKQAAQTDSGLQPSPLAALSLRTGLTEVSAQANETFCAYRKDGSLALRAQSSFDLQLTHRETSLEITLPAEMFGDLLKPGDFKNGPIQIQLEYFYQSQQVESVTRLREVKTLRKVEDILYDIGSALREVLKNRGDKTIQMVLDEEAVGILFSDPKTQKLIKELMALICMVNTLALEGGERDRYTIAVSGKGKPYLDVQQNTSVQGESNTVRLKLMITPPAENTEES